MLASFLASNYAFYSSNQGYAQGLVYPNYVNPSQFIGYSMDATKNITQSDITSKMSRKGQEQDSQAIGKFEKNKKTISDSSDVKFSIARILGETSPTESKDNDDIQDDEMGEPTSDVTEESLQYSWLHCTRYKPPKLQRKDFVYLFIC